MMTSDVDPDTHIRMVRSEVKNGKALGIDNVYNDILKKAIGTGFYKLLARAFTVSLKLGFIPYVWKVAVLCMLIKPDKPSQTTSYQPISLLSATIKLFERVIEKRLRKHLEDNGFFSKYQSGFRKSKSTNDHSSLSDHHGKVQSRRTCNSGLPRSQESLRQCLAQWTHVHSLPA